MHAHALSLNRSSVLSGRREKISNEVIWSVAGISILPFLMTVAGADFGSATFLFTQAGLSGVEISNPTEAAFHHLSGAFTHTILEWSAFCVAIFTVFLAFSHYWINRDPTAPIIAIALVCAGFMDAFHTLAADRLIDAVADNNKLIPFTWAVCRVFNALILITGIGLLLFKKQQRLPTSLSFLVSISAFFGVVAYAIIHFAATSSELPQTMFPDQTITRPWDFGPLLLYLFCGLYLFPLFQKKYPSIFAQSLIISTIPDVAVEAHMAFGSTALFDSHFNIAHFLKIIAYGVPLAGLMLDYSQTYQRQKKILGNLAKTQTDLEEARSSLSYIMRTSPAVIYRLDLAHDCNGTFISENIGSIMGYSSGQMLSHKFWEKHIHPDDLPVLAKKYAQLTEQQERHHSYEYRFKHRLGHYTWIHDSATVAYDENGQPLESVGSWTDITEIKAKEAGLVLANKELDEFAYIASHDLKEPLRGIHNYSQFLLEDYADKLDEDGHSKLETLCRLTQRMETLINTLLTFSRLGRVELSFDNTDLDEILAIATDTVHISLEERKIDLRVPRPLPTVFCDSIRIGEVFSNLITNAIKYNDKDEKWIEVGYHVVGQDQDFQPSEELDQATTGEIVFYVRDNGIGIREKNLGNVFRIFKRLHARDKFGGGTGVGLTIVKKIVERHSGEIWVHSTVGKGTTFYFTLSGGDQV